MFKGIRLIPDNTKYKFMRISRLGFLLSGILCTLSVLLFAINGLNVGIDFKGGTVLTIRTEQPANLDQLRETLGNLDLGGMELQEFGSPNDVVIRFGTQEGGDEAQQAAITKIKEALGPGIDYRSVEVVGPKVSNELAEQSIVAVVLSIFLVLVYIWFRFEWQFGVGAVASLLHDVILTIGLFSLLGIEFNLSVIAAILTIIGYSLNDTVVIFDRVREFLRKYKTMPFADLLDFSINSVLPRTLLTSMTTLIALSALYLFGGEVIAAFTFTMIIGVVIGTYSSYFIAVPILMLLGTERDAKKAAELAGRAVAAAKP